MAENPKIKHVHIDSTLYDICDDTRVSKSGDTMTGHLTVNSGHTQDAGLVVNNSDSSLGQLQGGRIRIGSAFSLWGDSNGYGYLDARNITLYAIGGSEPIKISADSGIEFYNSVTSSSLGKISGYLSANSNNMGVNRNWLPMSTTYIAGASNTWDLGAHNATWKATYTNRVSGANNLVLTNDTGTGDSDSGSFDAWLSLKGGSGSGSGGFALGAYDMLETDPAATIGSYGMTGIRANSYSSDLEIHAGVSSVNISAGYSSNNKILVTSFEGIQFDSWYDVGGGSAGVDPIYGYYKLPCNDGSTSSNRYTLATQKWVEQNDEANVKKSGDTMQGDLTFSNCAVSFSGGYITAASGDYGVDIVGTNNGKIHVPYDPGSRITFDMNSYYNEETQQMESGYYQIPSGDGSTSANRHTLATREWTSSKFCQYEEI